MNVEPMYLTIFLIAGGIILWFFSFIMYLFPMAISQSIRS